MVSPEDFEVLAQRITEPEYFIEFDLTDSARPGSVIASYNDAGLFNQGIHVDASMIRLMSALSTQLIAVVAVLVALVLAAVSVLALRYTVLAALEADLAQIAVLKAIGARRIARLYMAARLLALSAIGAIIGYGAGLPLGSPPWRPRHWPTSARPRPAGPSGFLGGGAGTGGHRHRPGPA